MGNHAGCHVVKVAADEDDAIFGGKSWRPEDARSFASSSSSSSSESEANELEFGFTKQSVIIFDWDDTLMWSSEIKAERTPGPEVIRELEESVAEILRTAMLLGRVVIVTNAHLSWVQATATHFLPKLFPLLQLLEIRSARQAYAETYPNDSRRWKREAFRDVLLRRSMENASIISPDASLGMPFRMPAFVFDREDTLFHVNHGGPYIESVDVLSDGSVDDTITKMARCHPPMQSFQRQQRRGGFCCNAYANAVEGVWHCPIPGVNLVVIGDSMADIQAGHHAFGNTDGSLLKTVKLISLPSFEDLLGQLKVVARELSNIACEERNLNKKLENTPSSGWMLTDHDVSRAASRRHKTRRRVQGI
eukprot:TRINITY_DN5751_c0_g1_i1.p1 TRINITY_DN5751_c0_g1~~TRINITY_DN5751_c0_g1_i1.p1  ORF type:complete len:363 (+),score=68.19 TRINITY_DN5751_c0_g1_i1:81-1169(+)